MVVVVVDVYHKNEVANMLLYQHTVYLTIHDWCSL